MTSQYQRREGGGSIVIRKLAGLQLFESQQGQVDSGTHSVGTGALSPFIL
jgi:hypothetical protein